MIGRTLLAATAVLAIGLSGQASAQAPTCDDLEWAAAVKAEYPDVEQSCQGVYEQGGKLYAKVSIEVLRVRGNRVTFRTLHTDGSKGPSHSVQVPTTWRADIAGRKYRASELVRGQELNVYMPQDRFAFATHDSGGSADDSDVTIMVEETVMIEDAVAMPTTASPLFLIGLGGGGLLAFGGLLTAIRRRRS